MPGRLLRSLLRLLRARDGLTAVEFSLAAPGFLLLVLGVIEGGRALWAFNTVQYAVEQTGRFAMLNATATDAELRDRAKDKAVGLDPDSITVDIAAETVGGVQYRQIDVTYAFSPLFADIIPLGPIDLGASARVPVAE